MDKLEPILKQKFWIILGLGVIMTITGWWMATGSLAATITQRKDALKKAEESIPTGETPNNDWTAKLSQINARQEAMVGMVRRALWQQQKDTYFWPPNVDDFARDAAYRSEFNLTARELYRTYYPASAEEVWKRVRPVNPLDGTGVVVFPYEKMPQKQFGELAPRSDEIWDAQEDLWLLVPIFDAIRTVNGGDEATRLDAVVHIIDRLELMGGERVAGEGGAAPIGGGDGDAGGFDGGAMPDVAMGGFGGGFGAGSGGGGAGAATPTPKIAADFDYREEFGGTGAAGNGGGGMAEMFGSADATGEGDGGGGMPMAPTIKRYIDEADNLPYKTRGFYLCVVMDHRRVPNLIGELTANGNSPWPMEIVRVQVSRLNDDDTEGRNLNLGGGGLMAGGNPPGAFGAADVSGESYNPSFSDPGSSGESIDYSGAMPNMMAPGGLSLEAALADPFMARVALAGLIYMYKAVDAPPPAETPAAGETPAVAAEPGVGPVPTDPMATPVPAEAATLPPSEGTPAVPAPPQPGTESAPAAAPAASDTPAAPAPSATESPPATPN